jgi:hypothetical protein
MILYTCTDGTAFGGLPGPLAHPCGRAAKALDDAGHRYERKDDGEVVTGSGAIAQWARENTPVAGAAGR